MKRETIAPASIQYFSLAQLYVSDLNPRQDADPEGIDLLADSLAMIGLIQNLSGILDGEGRVGIVAGGRRLRAIARAVERDATVTERHPELASIPVRIAPDEATARAVLLLGDGLYYDAALSGGRRRATDAQMAGLLAVVARMVDGAP